MWDTGIFHIISTLSAVHCIDWIFFNNQRQYCIISFIFSFSVQICIQFTVYICSLIRACVYTFIYWVIIEYWVTSQADCTLHYYPIFFPLLRLVFTFLYMYVYSLCSWIRVRNLQRLWLLLPPLVRLWRLCRSPWVPRALLVTTHTPQSSHPSAASPDDIIRPPATFST